MIPKLHRPRRLYLRPSTNHPDYPDSILAEEVVHRTAADNILAEAGDNIPVAEAAGHTLLHHPHY